MPGGSTPPGGQPPGGQPPGGQEQGQQPPGGQPPGGQQEGQLPPGGQGEGEQPGQQSQPTWDTQPPGGAAGGEETSGQPPGGTAGSEQNGEQPPGGEESWGSGTPGSGGDGWETSNQVPGGEASRIPPMPSERGKPPGQGDGDSDMPPGSSTAGGTPSSGNPSDGELDKALEDFDGDILAERAVIQARSNETAGTTNLPPELPGSSEQNAESGTMEGNPDFEPRGVPSNTTSRPAPPMAGATAQVPDDIPDARDDDIIARQLREAAMNEVDPELREKLWEEYRRYKG